VINLTTTVYPPLAVDLELNPNPSVNHQAVWIRRRQSSIWIRAGAFWHETRASSLPGKSNSVWQKKIPMSAFTVFDFSASRKVYIAFVHGPWCLAQLTLSSLRTPPLTQKPLKVIDRPMRGHMLYFARVGLFISETQRVLVTRRLFPWCRALSMGETSLHLVNA